MPKEKKSDVREKQAITIRCIRTCTIPKRGKVEEGKEVGVEVFGDEPWLGHFEGFEHLRSKTLSPVEVEHRLRAKIADYEKQLATTAALEAKVLELEKQLAEQSAKPDIDSL